GELVFEFHLRKIGYSERRGADGLPEFPQSLDTLLRRIAGNQRRVNRSDRNARYPVRMQIGLRQGLINAALIGPKGAAALQHQCDPLKRRALSRDMGLAQQRLMARHHGPPVVTVLDMRRPPLSTV